MSQLERRNLSSGAMWEDIVGYSRAVKVGHTIEISGCTAIDGNKIRAVGDPYGQSIFILEKISAYLQELGATLDDVVRTRIYVTDISRWEEVGKAHGAFFGSVKPATVMVEVSALIHPEMMVEIEATAIVK